MSCDLLSTQYGRVMDLSPGGLRLHAKEKNELARGRIVPVTLKCAHGAISLVGQVVWIRKSLQGGYEAGIQLHGVNARTAALIRQLAQFGFLPQVESSPTASSGGASPATGEPASFEDPYVVLGIDASASDAQVQAAYRKLAREFHPDHNQSPGAAAQFERVTRAYQSIRKRRCNFARARAA